MTVEPFTAVAAGGALAVVSSVHCLVMCGPLAVATRSRGGASSLWQYMAGRSLSYTLLGLMAGSVGGVLMQSHFARFAEAGLSWLLALSLLLTALGQLRGARKADLVQIGAKPRRSLLRSGLARVADEPLLLGMATAFLPCGVLFSAVLAAAAFAQPLAGALTMAAFAVTSSAVLLVAGQLARLGSVGASGRKVLGVVLLLGAALMLLRPLPSLATAGKPSCHDLGAR